MKSFTNISNMLPNDQLKKPKAVKDSTFSLALKQFDFDKLIPLFSMLIMFGFLQILSIVFYSPDKDVFVSDFVAPVEMSDAPFAVQVRNRRVALGLSRNTLGQKLNLEARIIAAIEEGEAVPTRDVAFALRRVLGLNSSSMSRFVSQ